MSQSCPSPKNIPTSPRSTRTSSTNLFRRLWSLKRRITLTIASASGSIYIISLVGYVEMKEMLGLPMVMAMTKDVEIDDALIAEAKELAKGLAG